MPPYVFDSQQIVHGSFTFNSYVMLEGKMLIDMYAQQFNYLTVLYATPHTLIVSFKHLPTWTVDPK